MKPFLGEKLNCFRDDGGVSNEMEPRLGLDQSHVSGDSPFLSDTSKANRTFLSRSTPWLLLAFLVGVFYLAVLAISQAAVFGKTGEFDSRPPPLWTHSYLRTTLSPIPPNKSDEVFRCLPNANGLLYLDDATVAEQGLPPGMPSDDGKRNLYAAAWAHEMYCLATIRAEIHGLMRSDTGLHLSPASRDSSHQTWVAEHLDECFEYLRQKIMCVADMTIEYPTGEDEEVISGFGIAQSCAVATSMGKWYEAHPPVAWHNFTGFGRYLKFPHWAEGLDRESSLS